MRRRESALFEFLEEFKEDVMASLDDIKASLAALDVALSDLAGREANEVAVTPEQLDEIKSHVDSAVAAVQASDQPQP